MNGIRPVNPAKGPWLVTALIVGLLGIGAMTAAAAAPDFPNTETRIKVSRVKADLSILAFLNRPVWYSDLIDDTVHWWYYGGSIYDISDYTPGFRTPDLGTTYTLASLAQIAGDNLQTTTSGYLLLDQVIISPHDSLELANETLLVGDQYNDNHTSGSETIYHNVMPRLIVRGRLRAENFTMKSAYRDTLLDSSGEEEWRGNGWGLLLTGQDPQGRSVATLTSCSLEALAGGLVLYNGAQAAITRSAFRRCALGVSITSGSQVTLQDCKFHESTVVAAIAKASITGCAFQGCGALFGYAFPGSLIQDCTLDGIKDTGYTTLFGIASSYNPDLPILRNHINKFGLGVFYDSSNGPLEDNTIENGYFEALVVGWQSNPRVRRNVIRHNATEAMPLDADHTTTVSAVVIYGGACPDLGTADDPGRNQFIDNGPFTLYHASATTDTVHAQGNNWGAAKTPQAVEELIYHQPDDGADADQSGFLSGAILFQPLMGASSGVRSAAWRRYR